MDLSIHLSVRPSFHRYFNGYAIMGYYVQYFCYVRDTRAVQI